MNLLQLPFYWQLVVKGLVILGAVYLDMKKKEGIGALLFIRRKLQRKNVDTEKEET